MSKVEIKEIKESGKFSLNIFIDECSPIYIENDTEEKTIVAKPELMEEVNKLVSIYCELPDLDRSIILSNTEAFKVRWDIEKSKKGY